MMTELNKEDFDAITVETEKAWYVGVLPRGRRPRHPDARVLVMRDGKKKWVTPDHAEFVKALPVRPTIPDLVKQASIPCSCNTPSVIAEIGQALVEFGQKLQDISNRAR